MQPLKLRRRFAFASYVGAAAMSVALLLGVGLAGTASAAITIPAFPGQAGAPVSGFDTYPWWLPAATSGGVTTYPISNTDISEGSDTTLYVMQSISDLYAQAGIAPFSCGILAAANTVCNQGSGGSNPNNTQSDETDNFSGSQELVGTNDVGSGNGQSELCNGSAPAAPAAGVDYSRSSKPVSSSTCPTGVELGFAKDAVVGIDFLNIDPAAYGTPTGYQTQVDPQCSGTVTTLDPTGQGGPGQYPSYASSSGAVVCTQFPSGGIGSVADGWLPGNSLTCTTTCTGTKFTNITNTPINGGTGATSVAYRLFCQHGPSTTPDTSQITDWGQLTNLAGGKAVGDGAPIGVPIRIIGINNGSGTVSTFYNFAQSGIGTPASGEPSTDCAGGSGNVGSGDVDQNAASGQDPLNNQGPAGTNFISNPEVSLENTPSQVGDFAYADWGTSISGSSDAADQAVDIDTSLYSMSLGAEKSNPNAEITSIENNPSATSGNCGGAGEPCTFTVNVMTANAHTAANASELNNTYPMARTLFNIYRTDTVRASTAGFLDWLCDSNTAPATIGESTPSSIQKETDHVDGGNFDTDLNNIIQNQYDFIRLTDSTQEAANTTPTDNVSGGGVNASCDANLPIAASGVSAGSTTITMAAPVSSTVQVGWPVDFGNGTSLNFGSPNSDGGPAYGTITNISGSTITVATAPQSSGSGSTPTTLYFPGQAPILQINTAGS